MTTVTEEHPNPYVCANCGASLTKAGITLLRCPICGTKVPPREGGDAA